MACFTTPPPTPPPLQVKGRGVKENNFNLTIAGENEYASRSRFKLSQTVRVPPASIFEEILVFSLTTSTKKKGSGATLGTLGKEKLKFTKKN